MFFPAAVETDGSNRVSAAVVDRPIFRISFIALAESIPSRVDEWLESSISLLVGNGRLCHRTSELILLRILLSHGTSRRVFSEKMTAGGGSDDIENHENKFCRARSARCNDDPIAVGCWLFRVAPAKQCFRINGGRFECNDRGIRADLFSCHGGSRPVEPSECGFGFHACGKRATRRRRWA